MLRAAFYTSVALILAVQAARADGDPDMGKRQFAPCTACHTTDDGGPDKVGPNLHGIFGRVAGTKPGFAYSNALKNSGITWDDAKLDDWIKKPAALVPGTKMAFIGLPNDQVRANIIAYLKQATN